MTYPPDRKVARAIIEHVGAHGVPPTYGSHFFTAGLDPYLRVIESEYLGSFIAEGGSSFKMIVGAYGGGKTHFMYALRDLAWRHNFVVTYVELSPRDCPFHKLELVYKAIVTNLLPPTEPEELLKGTERGIASLLRGVFADTYRQLTARGMDRDDPNFIDALLSCCFPLKETESISFGNAIKAAMRALSNDREAEFSEVCQWLRSEGFDRYVHGPKGIWERIDRTTAMSMLRSLGQWVRSVGYSGLVVLFDEAERVPSLSSGQRDLHLNNLRELIDECSHPEFQGFLICYAVPDEGFLEGTAQVYEALRQRVSPVFEAINPTGVKIDLERLISNPVSLLCEVGTKLVAVYEVAYGHSFDPSEKDKLVLEVANFAYEQRFGDIGYKRVFVQTLIRCLHEWRLSGAIPKVSVERQ
jgi:hypothetical protein